MPEIQQAGWCWQLSEGIGLQAETDGDGSRMPFALQGRSSSRAQGKGHVHANKHVVEECHYAS